MFIHFDRSSPVPIYLHIKESVRNLIVRGVLHPGERLPSTRQLAAVLGINRMTVDAAFSQLEADGLVSSHVGRGTFVNRLDTMLESKSASGTMDSDAISRLWPPLFADDQSAPLSFSTMTARNGSKAISFVPAAPGPDLFPAIDLRRCADFVLKRRIRETSSIGSSDGLASLKSYLVTWFAQNGMGGERGRCRDYDRLPTVDGPSS